MKWAKIKTHTQKKCSQYEILVINKLNVFFVCVKVYVRLNVKQRSVHVDRKKIAIATAIET